MHLLIYKSSSLAEIIDHFIYSQGPMYPVNLMTFGAIFAYHLNSQICQFKLSLILFTVASAQ